MVVGGVELVPLFDAVGVLGSLAQPYPGTPVDAWETYRPLYPEVFAANSWRLPCACYLLRSGDRTVLVDTGVGPPGLWDWHAEREGGLLPALGEQGIVPQDVDAVLVTHIHGDHVGWNADADGRAVFPRARYPVHADALAAAHERVERAHVPRCIVGIEERFDPGGGIGRVVSRDGCVMWEPA